MSKGRLPAILLNADFYLKPRNRRWIAKEGASSVIVLQMIWIALSQERDCKLCFDDICAIPFIEPFSDSTLKSFLDSCIEIGLLEFEGGFYFNSQIVSDSDKFKAKHDNYSKAAKSREGAKQKQDCAKIVPQSKHNHIDTDTDNAIDLDLSINLKEFDTAPIQAEVSLFAKKIKRDSNGSRELHQQTLDNWLTEYQGRPADFLDDLKFSNGLVRCWNLKKRDKPQARGSPAKKSTKETIQELYAQALAEEQNAKS